MQTSYPILQISQECPLENHAYADGVAFFEGVGSILRVGSMKAASFSSVICALRYAEKESYQSASQTLRKQDASTSWNPLTNSCSTLMHSALSCPVSKSPLRYSCNDPPKQHQHIHEYAQGRQIRPTSPICAHFSSSSMKNPRY